MPKIALFVYGTLKRGGRSNHFLANQEFLGEAETLPLYRLYDHGDHPCIVEDREHGVAVRGELWLVDEATLPSLDAYEEVPSWFMRDEIGVARQTPPIWAYLKGICRAWKTAVRTGQIECRKNRRDGASRRSLHLAL